MLKAIVGDWKNITSM